MCDEKENAQAGRESDLGADLHGVLHRASTPSGSAGEGIEPTSTVGTRSGQLSSLHPSSFGPRVQDFQDFLV